MSPRAVVTWIRPDDVQAWSSAGGVSGAPTSTASIALTSALVLVAVALLVVEGPVGRYRLRQLGAPPAEVEPAPLRPTWVAVGALGMGSIGWTLGGPVGAAVAACVAAGAGVAVIRGHALPGGRRRDDPGGSELAGRWELLAVCLEAGLPVAPAVAAAAEPLAGAAGDQLRRVAGLLELGSDPADAWRAATVPALGTFARAAGRSAGTGAALAQVARTEGTRIRSEMVDTAQARAQRAAVLITAPLGLCFLPAFMVLGIAPVVVGLAGEALAQW